MDTPVFDISQLTDEIAKCLCPHDLTRCVLVSKGWNASFTPRLWRNIVIKDNISSVKQDGIIRNQGHIRSIETHLGFIPATKHRFSPPNLQMIKFNHGHNNDCLVSNMLELAISSSCLQFISAYVTRMCTKSVKEWIAMLERHPRLQKFELEIFEVESLMVLQDLIQACHRLCRIDINFYGNLDDGDFNKQIVLAEGAMNKMRNIQLRELSFYAHDEVKRMFTFILLEKSPLIESIQLFGPSSEDLQRLASTLQNKGRSKLKQLNVKYDGSVGKNDLLELFHIIGHDGDTRHGADSNSEEHEGLQSLIFTDTDRYDLDQEILKGITQNFAKSLTNLHMDRIFMRLAFTCILLSRLSNLRSLKALLEVGLEDSTQDIDVWNQLQWSCLRLQKLDLDVYKRVSSDVIYCRLMEYVFAQIGRLVELEEWKMSMWNVFIMVDYSYLDHLTRLRRLWRVDLRESGFADPAKQREDLQRFASFLQNKDRSKLKQLNVKYNSSTERDGWLEFFHIVGYNGNTSHDIDGDDDGVGHDGLQSLIVTRADRYYLDQEILKEITQNFAKSLTNLHMDHIFLKLPSFCNLLRYLSNLKSLKVQLKNSIQDIDIWNQLQWSCLRLQKLDLEVYGRPSCDVIYSRLMDYVFAQIGRLTELEEWEMTTLITLRGSDDYGELTRESGLVHIDVVKWMAEYWPSIDLIADDIAADFLVVAIVVDIVETVIALVVITVDIIGVDDVIDVVEVIDINHVVVAVAVTVVDVVCVDVIAEDAVIEGDVFEGDVFEGDVFEGAVFENAVFKDAVFEDATVENIVARYAFVNDIDMTVVDALGIKATVVAMNVFVAKITEAFSEATI
ncbi:hypothetical protein BGZ46_003939 [Entomortierella lignicola]|nr:hypothetical protein BGZ46_003939 [Entomortierella lignicola]